MEKSVEVFFTDEVKRQAALYYPFSFNEMKLLGDFENYVFEVHNGEQPFILRFTHSSHRSEEMVASEMEWINHLGDNGAPVAKAIPSVNGHLVEVIPSGTTYFCVAAFEKAEGQLLSKQKEHWGPALFEKWGRTIGLFHRLTTEYKPSSTFTRPVWTEDDLLDVEGFKFDDELSQRITDLVQTIDAFPKDKEVFGMIHGDVHPGNFFYDGNKITVFDFDDAMNLWYVSDIAIALYYSLLWEKDLEAFTHEFMTAFMKGYRENYHLDPVWMERLPLFLMLRDITLHNVLVKKLDPAEITEKQRDWIKELRDRIIRQVPPVSVDFRQYG